MASPSKEENILKLILENSPLKEWHFEEIVKSAKVARLVANKWLKKYVSEGLLEYVKEKNRFPYYTVGSNNSNYYSIKRIYALEQLHKSGLIPKLLSLLYSQRYAAQYSCGVLVHKIFYQNPKYLRKQKYQYLSLCTNHLLLCCQK